MRAELLSVGTELLLGQIVDTNSAYLATRLASLGIDCLRMSTVGDNLERATETITRAIERADLVITTGGLGPTEDDLTREAIAAALGESPAIDPQLLEELRSRFGSRGMTMPESNLKQAWLIPSARAISNPLGTAPGWDVRHRGARIISMPGVPREMTRMWEEEVEPTLFGGAILRSRTLKLLGIGESAAEAALIDLVRSTAPTVATYAKNDGVHVRVTDKDVDEAAVVRRISTMESTIRERLGQYVWGSDDDTIASVIAKNLATRGWRLASAEAFTLGDVARQLAEVGDAYAGGAVLPGASLVALEGAAAVFAAEVIVLVPEWSADAEVILRTPEGEERAPFARGRGTDQRRRVALAALDLVRGTLSR